MTNDNTTGKERLIIITAPSGSGKTTIVRHLLEVHPELAFSVSACTRSPRASEINGVDYYFISPEEFRRKIAENAFAEYEMVYEGKYYGTLKSELQRIWRNNQLPLVDIDVKGALALQACYPGQVLSIFIQPPSLDVLRERLVARGTETSVSLEERLQKVAYELTFASCFHKTVLNDTLSHALLQIDAIVSDFISSGSIREN